MSSKLCEGGCGTEISGRRKRCPECRRLRRNSQERNRYEVHADDINERRLLQRYGPAAFEAAEYGDEPEVVDYTKADAAPGLRPVAHHRQNPRHDAVTRARLDRQAQEPAADPELADWGDLVAMRERFGMRTVDFPAPDMGSYAPDPLGRSVPRSRGLYGRNDDPRELVNPAAEGVAIVASPVAGQRALQAAQESRFGPGISMPAPIHSSQLHSSMPAMERAERAVVVQRQAASEHSRSLGWTRR
jgi:hypothetical protein